MSELERALRGIQAAILREAPYGRIYCSEEDYLILLPDSTGPRFQDILEIYVKTEATRVFVPLLRRLGEESLFVFVDGRHAAAFAGGALLATSASPRGPSVHPSLATILRLGLEPLLLLDGKALETATGHERLEARRCFQRCTDAGLTLLDFDLGYVTPLPVRDARIETTRQGPLLVLLVDGDPMASLLLEDGACVSPKIPMPALDPTLASLLAAAGHGALVGRRCAYDLDLDSERKGPLVRIDDEALRTLLDLGLLCERPDIDSEYWAVGAPPNVRLDTEEVELLRRACQSIDPDGMFPLNDAERLQLTRAQRARLVLVSPGTHACLTEAGAALLAGTEMPAGDEAFLPLRPKARQTARAPRPNPHP